MNRFLFILLLFLSACRNDAPQLKDTEPAHDAPFNPSEPDTLRSKEDFHDVGGNGETELTSAGPMKPGKPGKVYAPADRFQPWDWSPVAAPDQYFTINPTMVTPSSGFVLFDGQTSTAWHPGWSAYPATATVNFTLPLNVTRMRVYDENGDGNLVIKAGVFQKTLKLDKYQGWHELPINHKTQGFSFTLTDAFGDRQVPEIEIFTSDSTVVFPPDPPVTGTCDTLYWCAGVYQLTPCVVKPGSGDTVVVNPPIDTSLKGQWSGDARRIGWNAFHWTKMDLLKQIPAVRIWFDNNYWLTANGIAVNPLHAGSKPDTENADEWLTRLKSAGVDVVLCLENWPYWDRSGGDIKWNDPGKDPNNPDSYGFVSRAVQNLAYRYATGVKAGAFSPWVNTTARWNNDRVNEVKKGLGLIGSIEVENEPTRWWKGADERYTATEYAALLFKVYPDVKAVADVPVVMGGLSELNVTYLKGMKAYFDARGVPFRSDAINVHYYANLGGKDIGDTDEKLNLTKEGCAPEMDGFYERMKRVTDFAKSIGLPVWLSEFGYDTDPVSPQRSPAFGPYDSEQVCGIWVQRTVLEGIRAGVSKFYAYNSINEPSYDPNNPNGTGGLYRTHGFATAEQYGQVPKKNFYALLELVNELNGYAYSADLSTAKARIMRFTSAKWDKFVYWMPVAQTDQTTITINGQSLTATEKPKFYRVDKVATNRAVLSAPDGYSKPKPKIQ
jgi:hypothetical protein